MSMVAELNGELAPLTKRDVMRILQIGSTTYHKLIAPDARTGQPLLESFRLFDGGPRRVSQAALRVYLESRTSKVSRGLYPRAASLTTGR